MEILEVIIIMRPVYIRTLISDLYKKKISIIITAVVFAVLLAFIGYRSATDAISPEDQEKIAEYEEALDNYEQIISEAEDNIAISEEQVTNYQEYIDNSIYMKLDSQVIKIATAQFAINDAENQSNVLNGYTTYINDGALKEQIYEKIPDIPVEYLKELISCSTSGNVLTVTVMHYDADAAKKIMDTIESLIFSQKKTISDVQGNFNIESLGSTYYTKADVGVLNNQNTYLGNLKNYQNSLADYQKKLVDGRTNRDNYIKNYTPDAYGKTPASPVNNAIKYFIFGAILGVILSCAIIALRFITSTRLKDTNELLNAGLATLGILDGKNQYHPNLERSVLDIKMMAERNDVNSVFLGAMGYGKDFNKVIEDYTAKLKEADVSVSSGTTQLQDENEAKSAIDAGNGILIVKIGDTRFEQIEEQLKLYQKFGISMWGCIVIG